MTGHRCNRWPSDAPTAWHRLNRCSWFLQNSSNSTLLWVLFSCFTLLGLFTSSLRSRNVHLIKALVPLIALSFDHQNHSKCHKWCHVRYNMQIYEIKVLVQCATNTWACLKHMQKSSLWACSPYLCALKILIDPFAFIMFLWVKLPLSPLNFFSP